MKTNFTYFFKNIFTFFAFYLTINSIYSQNQAQANSQSTFWQKVQFGGGLGLSFGDFTNVSIAPTAIYNVNETFSAGTGLQYSYISSKNFYNATTYGGSILTLFNPIESVQLSAELEQLKVSSKIVSVTPNFKTDFWNTALFVGAGYRFENITVGARYNLLFDKDKNVYSSAFLPFVRAFF